MANDNVTLLEAADLIAKDISAWSAHEQNEIIANVIKRVLEIRVEDMQKKKNWLAEQNTRVNSEVQEITSLSTPLYKMMNSIIEADEK